MGGMFGGGSKKGGSTPAPDFSKAAMVNSSNPMGGRTWTTGPDGKPHALHQLHRAGGADLGRAPGRDGQGSGVRPHAGPGSGHHVELRSGDEPPQPTAPAAAGPVQRRRGELRPRARHGGVQQRQPPDAAGPERRAFHRHGECDPAGQRDAADADGADAPALPPGRHDDEHAGPAGRHRARRWRPPIGSTPRSVLRTHRRRQARAGSFPGSAASQVRRSAGRWAVRWAVRWAARAAVVAGTTSIRTSAGTTSRRSNGRHSSPRVDGLAGGTLPGRHR